MIDSSASDEDIVRLLADIKSNHPVDAVIAAELATILADSGDRFFPDATNTADVASTGGPSSLSTLLCPLFLRAAKFHVIKLGVPGRPAGGIDCLAQLQGYRTELSPEELTEVLRRNGFAHFQASDRYAPLDARVFQLRQLHGFQSVATLAAASLLAKKRAVGVRYAGLDVRVGPHGNFGRSAAEGAANAAMFIDAAGILGVEARPVLTDGVHPYQPYIGRKEALAALWLLFESNACEWLASHFQLCRTLSLACVPSESRTYMARIGVGQLKEVFYCHLEAQGGSPEDFVRVSRRTLDAHAEILRAPVDGFVHYSLAGLRDALYDVQRFVGRSEGRYADPAGLILLKRPGEWVQRGEPVATLRLDPGVPDRLAVACRNSFTMHNHPEGPGLEAVRIHG